MDAAQSAPKNALWEREKQLRLWDDSETNRASSAPRDRQVSAVKFHDGCVFLAACSSGDTKEVLWLLGRGADINTANVDGLTALHQACIDDNLPMVRFLVEHGADIDAYDNEGWTALHATASCGFIDIAKYLVEKGARLDAVNNDGELAIDLAEGKLMEVLLTNAMEKQGIDAEVARKEEEEIMLQDANQWLNGGFYDEKPHAKTGAMALHVAAAKGYIKVIKLLVEAGADVNARDFDGWTPLHAAAHWGQDEACKILVENFSNLSAVTSAGQTPIDLADPDVENLLEELKKKQDLMKKDLETRNLNAELNREISPGKYGPRRSSVTRMSVDQRQVIAQKTAEDERSHLHSVLSEVTEDTVSGTDTDSGEAELGKNESESDSESPPTSPDSVSQSSTADRNVDSVTSVQQNGSKDSQPASHVSISSSSSVNGLPASTVAVEKAPEPLVEKNDISKRHEAVIAADEPKKTQVTDATTKVTSASSTTKLGVIGRQSSTAGQKTEPTVVSSASTTNPVLPGSPSQTSRLDDAPAMWRAGLRKTGSADIVCPASSVAERSDLDKLSRSSSISWSAPSRQTAATPEHAALRRTGSSCIADSDSKPRTGSPAFQQQSSTASLPPSGGDRSVSVTDLYARYKAQLIGRPTVSTTTNGVIVGSGRPTTPVMMSMRNSQQQQQQQSISSSSPSAVTSSSRILPSTQWMRRQRTEPDTIMAPNILSTGSTITTTTTTTTSAINSQRRLMETAKRDEEKEIERKARAKRARETRRSTQGVSKEDLEKAGVSLHGVCASSTPAAVEPAVESTSPPSTERPSLQQQRTLSLTDEDDPLRSYRKSREPSFNESCSTFSTGFMRSIRDAGLAAALAGTTSPGSLSPALKSASPPVSTPSTSTTSSSTATGSLPSASLPAVVDSTSLASVSSSPCATSSVAVRTTTANSLPGNSSEDGDEGVTSAAARARRRRESRRPLTGNIQGISPVVSSSTSDASTKNDCQGGLQRQPVELTNRSTAVVAMATPMTSQHFSSSNCGTEPAVIFRSDRLPVTCLAVTGCAYTVSSTTTAPSSSSAAATVSAGAVTDTISTPAVDDGRLQKLYEQEQQVSNQLRNQLQEVKKQLGEKQLEIDRLRESIGPPPSPSILMLSPESSTDRREKRALERKISELEEELKELHSLRTENQRLRDENGALIRVISKLSK